MDDEGLGGVTLLSDERETLEPDVQRLDPALEAGEVVRRAELFGGRETRRGLASGLRHYRRSGALDSRSRRRRRGLERAGRSRAARNAFQRSGGRTKWRSSTQDLRGAVPRALQDELRHGDAPASGRGLEEPFLARRGSQVEARHAFCPGPEVLASLLCVQCASSGVLVKRQACRHRHRSAGWTAGRSNPDVLIAKPPWGGGIEACGGLRDRRCARRRSRSREHVDSRLGSSVPASDRRDPPGTGPETGSRCLRGCRRRR